MNQCTANTPVELKQALAMYGAADLNDRAAQLLVDGNPEAAIPLLRDAIAVDPTCAMAHANLGAALKRLGVYGEALTAYEAALDLEPNSAVFNSNYADALTHVGRFADAIDFLQHAIVLRPDMAEAFNNLGMAFWGANRLPQAIMAFRTAVALQPDLADAHMNRGIVLLTMGRYAEGWAEYDWRWTAQGAGLRRPYDLLLWDGSVVGGELVVWSEQGLGDEILQASMIADTAKLCRNLVWECDPRLVTLLRRSCPGVEIVPRVWPLPATYQIPFASFPMGHIPAMSLGHHVRRASDAFPRERRSYLVPDPVRVAELRERLPVNEGQRIVGISWASRDSRFGAHKSTKLADWLPLSARLPSAWFVDLQYGDTAAERAAVPGPTHLDGLDLTNDIEGLAALISLCSLVVTVSNSTAHLAGALGIPTLVLVGHGAGKLWYWGMEQTETPDWYPSVTIIRQGEDETWLQVLLRVARRVAEQEGWTR